MDIAITRPNKKRRMYLFVLPLLIIPLMSIGHYLWQMSQADYSIDQEKISLGEVKRGDFSVSVHGTGLLVPDNIQWLSASSESKVERLAVKAGKLVKKGDLIVELSNPQLEQQLAETRWELEAMMAEQQADRVSQESALLEQKSNVLNAKLNYESSLLELNAQKELLNTHAVSKLDYERTRLATIQLKQRWHNNQERMQKMQENLVAQNNARNARLQKNKKILERIQQRVDELMVLASMDSIVLEIPLEPGQRLNMGSNIAKLAQQDSLIAELQVPEIHIRNVATGQRVIVDTRNNLIDGRVARIDPAVINGKVQVDVQFSQALPNDARPDLSVDGEIKITELADTLYVERPLFAQSQSHTSIYKVSDNGLFAERQPVKIGYGSINHVQILSGLQIGDKIVISDSSTFESYEKIRIN